VDLEARITPRENLTFVVGGENIFDEFPDDETNTVLRSLGATRPISSPFGFNGLFWYVRGTVDF
jgi:iron complex outermembrane receptor protein